MSDLLHSKDPADFNRPHIQKHDGHEFRSYQTPASDCAQKPAKLPAYNDNDNLLDCFEVEDDCEITKTKEGKLEVEYHVTPLFLPNIVGLKGSKKRQIEQETRTEIKVPRKGVIGPVFISGNSEKDVVSAKNRIHLIVLEMRDKQPATHFVSIPMYSEGIAKNFEVFKSSVLNGPHLPGVDASIFHKPRKFHVTVALVVMLDHVEIEQGSKTFQECKEIIASTLFENEQKEQLQLVIEGVEIMNDDPTCVDVLYGKVAVKPAKYTSKFQKCIDAVSNHFAKKGLIRKQYDSVKLHVTLMNSIFRKPEGGGPTDYKTWKREPFDATHILEKYKDFHFGTVDLSFLHLSVRFTTNAHEYYESLSTIPFM